jgi:hypothetical protein
MEERTMTKTRALLLCSTAALLTFSTAGQAAPLPATDSTAALRADSYTDLLEPIPNAVALLEADNQMRAQQAPQARIQLAQYHHHHHHSYHHHHHHYHHHHSHFPWGVFRGFVEPPPAYYPEHCYWTWGRAYWNGYRWVRPRVRVCD